jgi:type II secretory pathway predicted ATPase ExeA
MYENFYGLTRSPFELSPDPHFFFPTPSHNEALATLSYAVMRRKGFVVVTGEVGTGKTLLLRYLLEFISRNRVTCAFVYNPLLSVTDFLGYVLTDLKLSLGTRTKGEMLSYLNDYLLLRSRRGDTTAIIVDEAHLLSWELMEEIRLLTNLETSQHKLMQMVLVGQPELDKKLDSPGLRQLKQRVSLRCHLKPLTFEESRGYVHRRLKLAGANSHAGTIFPDDTIAVIYDFSHGIPRVINTICDNCLISGYGKQAREITAELAREVSSDLRLSKVAVGSPRGQQGIDTGTDIPLVSTGVAMPETLTPAEPGVENQ